MQELLGFQMGSIGQGAGRHVELYKAHEKYVGQPPSSFEKLMYGFLSLNQLDAKIAEFKDLQTLHDSTR